MSHPAAKQTTLILSVRPRQRETEKDNTMEVAELESDGDSDELPTFRCPCQWCIERRHWEARRALRRNVLAAEREYAELAELLVVIVNDYDIFWLASPAA